MRTRQFSVNLRLFQLQPIIIQVIFPSSNCAVGAILKNP